MTRLSMEQLVAKARELAVAEINRYQAPSMLNFTTSYQKGMELAVALQADLTIVQLGTLLMDLKLGESFAAGKLGEHVARSSKAAADFLAEHHCPLEVAAKVINCVEGHHKNVPWTCIEAEICANADCYRFLFVRNWLDAFSMFYARSGNLAQGLAEAKKKFEEKLGILSLDICRKELEPHIRTIREAIALFESGAGA